MSICQIAVLFYLMIIVYWGKNWGKVWGTKDMCGVMAYTVAKYSLQGTTQGRYLTGGVPPVRFSM